MFNLVMLKNPSQILGYSVGYVCVYRTHIGMMPVQFVLYTHELVGPYVDPGSITYDNYVR